MLCGWMRNGRPPAPRVDADAYDVNGIRARHLLVATDYSHILASTDAGRDLVSLGLPPGAQSVASVVVATTGTHAATLYALVPAGNDATTYRLNYGSGPWIRTSPLPGPPQPGSFLVALSGQRVIRILSRAGLACTADGGLSWAMTCPPE